MEQEKPKRNCIANLKKLHYPTLPLTNIQTLKIREIDLDFYCFDKKAKYIFLDKLIKTRILIVYAY